MCDSDPAMALMDDDERPGGSARERVVAALVEAGGKATQPDISKRAGLSRSVVHGAVHDLSKRGSVRLEAAEGQATGQRSTAGRPPQIVTLEAQAGYVLGIAFGQRSVRVGVAD